MDKGIKQQLIGIVGKKNFTEALIDRVTYSMDFSEHRHDLEGAVWPTSTEQVSEILKLANRERIPVTPRGAGTGATGMAVPQRGGIVLDLVRMNKILTISIEDRLAVVQPGVVYADLQKALSPFGFSILHFCPKHTPSIRCCQVARLKILAWGGGADNRNVRITS